MFSFSFCPKCASCFLGPKYIPLIGSKTVWLNLQNTAIPKNCLSLPASPSLTRLEVCQLGKICDFTSAATKTLNLSHRKKKRPRNSCHLFVYIWRSERQLHFFQAKTSLSAGGSAGWPPDSTYRLLFIRHDGPPIFESSGAKCESPWRGGGGGGRGWQHWSVCCDLNNSFSHF